MINKKQYILLTGILVTFAGLLHLTRVLNSWPMLIGDWEVPISLSIGLAAFALFLGFSAWKLKD